MEVFIFSQDEQPLTVISAETGLVEAPYRIEINSVPTEPFSFVVDAQHPTSEHVKDENKVVFKDHEGDYRLFVIKRLKDSSDISGSKTRAVCLPVYHAELNDHVIEERRFIDQTVDVAMEAAVQGTRWQAVTEVELGRATTNFYRIFSTEALEDIINTWGGEIKDVVTFDERTNRITGCYLKLIQRHGKEHGQRMEIGHNVVEIEREVLSYPKTALYGFGSSLEVEDEDGEHTGGYTRYIDFGEVEWKKSNGDPVDKPKGQKWVGDPEALKVYGYEGKKKHRFGIFSNQDYEDPADLLQATWEALQDAKKPEVNYRLSVELFNEKVSLGDTCQAIDRMFARPIEIQARVIAMEYDLMDIEGTMVVEMGQFLDLGDEISDIKEEIENIKNNPPKQKVDESSYPDRKPSTPINVEAYGGMEVVQLYWQYANELFIKHYEVYGSRTEDFVPDSQHLLWRGQVSSFAHTVGTDEVWYYRIRAVNYHGTPSDWSVQVRAATHRVISDDILFDPELAERMRELSEIAQTIADGTINFDHLDGTIINGNRIKGDLIAVDGTTYIEEGVIGSAAIADAAIDRAHLRRAIIGEAQIEDLAVTSAKIASVNADKVNAASLSAISANMGTITAGRLNSNNNNMDLNLNTGNLTMRNAYFTLGNGARIDFTAVGNRIQYRDVKDGTVRSAGFGVGKSLQDYPFAYSGTTGDRNLDTLSEWYSGAMWHTTRAIAEGASNSISGFRFMFRNKAVDWDKSIEFDFNGTPTIKPRSHGKYDIGTSGFRFRRIYVDNVLGWRTVYISNPTANRGFAIDTDHVDGHNPSIYGQYPANNNYNIGRSDRYMTYVYTNSVRANYLHGALQGNSARKFKKNEDSMDLADSLEFIRNAKIITFDWIRDESMKFNKDNPQTIYDRQVGFIIDDLKMRNDYLVKSDEETIKKDNILFMHQHVIQDNLRRLDSIDEELNWQRIEYQALKNKVTKLEDRIKQLEESAA